MKWKDTAGENPPSEQPAEDYLDEETYSPWEKGSPGSLFSRWTRKSALPYILAAVGVLILLIALGNVFTRSAPGNGIGTQGDLDKRLLQVEEQMRSVEKVLESISRLDDLEKKNEQLKGRFDRMEAALALRMDHITQQLETAKSAPPASAPASKPAAAAAPPPAPAPEKAPVAKAVKKTPAKYYTVKAGDTLYGISRANGLTVAQLRELNDLSKDRSIQPGQKLLVRRAGE